MSLSSNVTDLATRVGTEAKALRTMINGNAADLASLTTTAKSNLVAAINEIEAAVSASSGIDDGVTGTSTTWSSQKITDEDAATLASANGYTDTAVGGIDITDLIDDVTPSSSTTYSSTKIGSDLTAAINNLVDSAPGTLDTLNELAAALGDDPAFATTVTTALGNRVRTDTAAQGLDSTQQSNARTNIDAASATAVGSTSANYVTTFEAALV